MDHEEWHLLYFDDISFVFYPNELNSFIQTIPRLTLYKTPYILVHTIVESFSPTIKSKDLQKLVLSKCEKGEGPSKVFRHLNGA